MTAAVPNEGRIAIGGKKRLHSNLKGDPQVVVDRDSSRPRRFEFVTFTDCRAMQVATRDMHGRELEGLVITVNKAQPKLGGEYHSYGYGREELSGGRDEYRDRYKGEGTSQLGNLSASSVGVWGILPENVL
ncbi:hypothetical protein U1Q18_008307 [Sarracenia purpurea var. burkii]